MNGNTKSFFERTVWRNNAIRNMKMKNNKERRERVEKFLLIKCHFMFLKTAPRFYTEKNWKT